MSNQTIVRVISIYLSPTLVFKYCTFILTTPKMSIHLEVDVMGCKPGQLECGVVSLEVDVAARKKDKRKGGEN